MSTKNGGKESNKDLVVTTHILRAIKDGSVDTAQSNVREVEDEFNSFYVGTNTEARGEVIKPPYDLTLLERMETENNALGPCVDAMETNIDGTGYAIDPMGGDAPTPEQEKAIEDIEAFFDEPWPGMSFTTMRRKIRRDLERTGNGYLEILRNAKGEIVFVRTTDARTIRLVKLDAAVPVKKKIKRRGKEFEATVYLRERRFAQVINSKLVYFKELGATRDLDKDTGKWAVKGTGFNMQKRATELLHFIVKKDNTTPYGVPRWINQTPSVLGSRKAEEHNLEFFDRGGIPPLLVMVQGGSVAAKSVEALDNVLNASAQGVNAAVVEVYGQGSLDKGESPVKVTVERFGSERQNDSMFESYDEKAEARIRSAFRLPPLFVGRADSYNFATAFASYTVAEAQVFQPERMEFDEIVNIRIMPEIGGEDYVYRSLPLSVKDAQHQLKAIEMAAGKSAIDKEQMVDALNEVTNTGLKFAEESDMPQPTPPVAPGVVPPEDEDGKPPAKPTATPVEPPTPKAKSEHRIDIIKLASTVATEVIKGKKARDPDVWFGLMADVAKLDPDEERLFKSLLAVETFGDISLDPGGAGEVAACTFALMAANLAGDDEPVH